MGALSARTFANQEKAWDSMGLLPGKSQALAVLSLELTTWVFSLCEDSVRVRLGFIYMLHLFLLKKRKGCSCHHIVATTS